MGVIFMMLLFVYRSIVTVLLVLVMMFIELSAARGIVAALGYYDLIGLVDVRGKPTHHTGDSGKY